MPDTLFPHNFIKLAVAPDGHPASELAIVFKTAPEKPALGEPGKQTGDVTLSGGPTGRTALVSLGDRKKIISDTFRQAGGALARWLAQAGVSQADIDLSNLAEYGDPLAAQAVCEGLRLGAYRFNHYKSETPAVADIDVYLRNASDAPAAGAMIERVKRVTDIVNLGREWAHEPANVINPLTLAERAQAAAAQFGLKCTIFDDQALAEMQAGAILAVGKGSQTPSRLIVLEYSGRDAPAGARPVVLVGKALTFDSGGYSIKDSTNIVGMKYDKCGGLAVLATLIAAAALRLPVPVVGVIGAAENMVSEKAYRPDDIITTLSGKTVEIISTDAEGRLVLADALSYAQRAYQPRALIDLATLTGGVVVALGKVRAGLLSNNDELAAQLFQAGERTHERLWRLPLDEDYFQSIKGDDADIKNSGGREGHCILGGTFLKQFVDDAVAWAHLDIAGMADAAKDLPYCPKGGTGFGVRLLIDYLENLA